MRKSIADEDEREPQAARLRLQPGVDGDDRKPASPARVSRRPDLVADAQSHRAGQAGQMTIVYSNCRGAVLKNIIAITVDRTKRRCRSHVKLFFNNFVDIQFAQSFRDFVMVLSASSLPLQPTVCATVRSGVAWICYDLARAP